MGKLLTILTLLILSVSSASGQILHYEVVKGSKKLGDMKVERRAYSNEVEYFIESKVVFRLLFSFTIDYNSSALYRNNELIRESTTNKLNGSSQKASSIIKQGDHYSHTLNGVSSTEKGPINYTVASIYFNEPHDGKRVFSPQFGKYLTFEKVGANQYKLESPDGTNLYTYLNGICTEVKVSRDFAKFYFKMTPETYYAVKNQKDSVISGN